MSNILPYPESDLIEPEEDDEGRKIIPIVTPDVSTDPQPVSFAFRIGTAIYQYWVARIELFQELTWHYLQTINGGEPYQEFWHTRSNLRRKFYRYADGYTSYSDSYGIWIDDWSGFPSTPSFLPFESVTGYIYPAAPDNIAWENRWWENLPVVKQAETSITKEDLSINGEQDDKRIIPNPFDPEKNIGYRIPAPPNDNMPIVEVYTEKRTSIQAVAFQYRMQKWFRGGGIVSMFALLAAAGMNGGGTGAPTRRRQ